MKFNRLFDMEQYIAANGATSLEELSRHYDVSMSTIRRDIAELVRRRNFSKVYGGVTAGFGEEARPAAAEWRTKNEYAKQAIGRLAAQLVQDDMSVFLDSGSTTPQILPFLAEKRNVTVISCSLGALCEAAKYPSLHVIALGGMYNGATSSFLGGSTADELEKMYISVVFLSAAGVTLERGLTSTSYSELEMKRAVVKRNKNLVLMADHSKFGRDALLPFCGFGDLAAIVTDQPLKSEYSRANALRHIRVIAPEIREQGGDVQANIV